MRRKARYILRSGGIERLRVRGVVGDGEADEKECDACEPLYAMLGGVTFHDLQGASPMPSRISFYVSTSYVYCFESGQGSSVGVRATRS
jgi:hypothetical protein